MLNSLGDVLKVAATIIADWESPDPDMSASIEKAFGEVRLFVHDYSENSHRAACSSLTLDQAVEVVSTGPLEAHFKEMLDLLVDDLMEQREDRNAA